MKINKKDTLIIRNGNFFNKITIKMIYKKPNLNSLYKDVTLQINAEADTLVSSEHELWTNLLEERGIKSIILLLTVFKPIGMILQLLAGNFKR